MQGVVKKWGNSATVRIPASVLDAARMRVEQRVDVREEGGRIVIEPVREAGPTLAALVAGITEENVHAAVETGAAVGRESW